MCTKPLCGRCHKGKFKASQIFGYLTLSCDTCELTLTSEHRSGSFKYLWDIEMKERWIKGK